jgi:hypothetical protein
MKRVIAQEVVTVDGLATGPNDEVHFIPTISRDDPR